MSTVVQDTKATNILAQTFNIIYSGTPVEGNFLVAFLFHDETFTDIADITSAGWVRMGTAVETLGGFPYRISVFAKFAGASEPTTVAVDLGEVNRRTHGYAVEFSGVPLVTLPAEDLAASETKGNTLASTSNQLDNPIKIGAGQFGLVGVTTNNSSSTPPTWTADPPTFIDNWNNNFKATAIGYIDPTETVQPTATWNQSRANMQTVFVLGEALIPVTIKRHSSFQLVQTP